MLLALPTLLHEPHHRRSRAKPLCRLFAPFTRWIPTVHQPPFLAHLHGPCSHSFFSVHTLFSSGALGFVLTSLEEIANLASVAFLFRALSSVLCPASAVLVRLCPSSWLEWWCFRTWTGVLEKITKQLFARLHETAMFRGEVFLVGWAERLGMNLQGVAEGTAVGYMGAGRGR